MCTHTRVNIKHFFETNDGRGLIGVKWFMIIFVTITVPVCMFVHTKTSFQHYQKNYLCILRRVSRFFYHQKVHVQKLHVDIQILISARQKATYKTTVLYHQLLRKTFPKISSQSFFPLLTHSHTQGQFYFPFRISRAGNIIAPPAPSPPPLPHPIRGRKQLSPTLLLPPLCVLFGGNPCWFHLEEEESLRWQSRRRRRLWNKRPSVINVLLPSLSFHHWLLDTLGYHLGWSSLCCQNCSTILNGIRMIASKNQNFSTSVH